MDEIKQCMICFRQNTSLYKICNTCTNSYCCYECYKEVENRNISTCPMCRSQIIIKTKYCNLFNVKYVLKKNLFCILFILIILIINFIIYCYYQKIDNNK